MKTPPVGSRTRSALPALAVTALLWACSAAPPQEVPPRALGERLAATLREAPAPGGQVAAVSPAGIVADFALGWAELGPADPGAAQAVASGADGGRPVTPDTAFLWFSTTKLITATAVMQLVEQGRVELDAPVRRYVPDFLPGVAGAEAVTVRHLLSHSAGLRNPVPVTWIHLASEPAPALDALVAQRMGDHGALADPPGTRSRYSNLGYLVLGQLIERVSGEPYAAYVQRHILAPLRMKRSGFAVAVQGATGPDAVPPPLATGYSRPWSLMGLAAWWMVDARFFAERHGPYTALRPFGVDGAPYGGLVSTARDMARFAAMHLNSGTLEGRSVLSPESVAAMQQAQPLADGTPGDFGLGWHVGAVGPEPSVWHEGGGGGFHAEVRLYPRLGRGIVAVGNESSFPTASLTRLAVRGE